MTSDELQAYLDRSARGLRAFIKESMREQPNDHARVWELCFDALAAAWHEGRRAGAAEGRAAAAPPAPPPRDGIHVVPLHPTTGMCEHCGTTREVLAFSLGGFRVQLCGACLREFAETAKVSE